jgi:GNAT superfamily N-acetyltransferase
VRFVIRKATGGDIAEIERVMRESLIGLGSLAYDRRQIASSLEHVAHIDRHLIDDGTYFVALDGETMVGCGGWSRRGKLYAGSAAQAGEDRFLDPASEPARVRAMFVVPQYARRGIGRYILECCEEEARAAGFREVELMAMLSGQAMYAACGYTALEHIEPLLADGTPLPMTRMKKSIA